MSGAGEALLSDYERRARERFAGMTAAELEDLPRLAQGQADDLKVDDGDGWRVWLCRCGVEDGMPFDNQVTVERLIDGRWITVAVWEAS